MKHKTLLLSFFVFAALVTAGIVRAEDSTSTDDTSWKDRMEERRNLMKENATERRDLMKENIEERRDGIKARFDEFRKGRIGGMIEMMKNRFEWAIARLENIADRVEARIEKIESETGEKLTDARTHLDEARTNIENATKLLAEIDTDVDAITSDETKTDEKFSGFRDAFAAVKAEIKAAWQHLREAIDAIKGTKGDEDKRTMDGKKEGVDDWKTTNSN